MRPKTVIQQSIGYRTAQRNVQDHETIFLWIITFLCLIINQQQLKNVKIVNIIKNLAAI